MMSCLRGHKQRWCQIEKIFVDFKLIRLKSQTHEVKTLQCSDGVTLKKLNFGYGEEDKIQCLKYFPRYLGEEENSSLK